MVKIKNQYLEEMSPWISQIISNVLGKYMEGVWKKVWSKIPKDFQQKELIVDLIVNQVNTSRLGYGESRST